MPLTAPEPSNPPCESGPGDPGIPVVLDTRVVCGTGGGPEKTILNSPRFLNALGYRNLCAYMHPPDDPCFAVLRQKAQALGAPLLSVPDRGPWDWRVAFRLLQICREENVAIWHGHDYKSNVLGLLLRRFWPMRLVTTVHGWGVEPTWRTPLYHEIDRFCLPHYDRVICVSDDLYERCLKGGVPPNRCVLIENGIDTEQYSRCLDTRDAKARLGLSPDRLLIGAVGRLSGEKGFDVLIDATDRLLGMGLDLELHIVGEGGERNPLQERIDRLGQSSRIRLLGYRPDTIELYEAMDIFALSSHSEGLPNVVLEAMALGVPVVATRVGGIPRLIEHGTNGWLVAPGSVDDLAGALAYLLTAPESLSRLGRAGRGTIENNYSLTTRMGSVAMAYSILI